MPEAELFISVDIEADGRIPGRNSMLSFGSAAFTLDKTIIDSFTVNLEFLPGASGDPETLAWWRRFPEAWAAARESTEDPAEALPRYADHLEALARTHGRPTFVGFPAAFDFAWINWYLHRFAGRNPLGTSGLCLKTLAAALLKCPFRQATKRRFPRRWFDDLPHSHVALDDAIEQGALGVNMLRELHGLPRIEGIVEGRGS